MPLTPHGPQLIRSNLEKIRSGKKAKAVVVGTLTPLQLSALNAERSNRGFQPMDAEVVFNGKHIYESRVLRDGYTIDDVILQISQAMNEQSKFHANPKMNGLVSTQKRDDGYGNLVVDTVVFECTTKYPKAELYSVIPKGDKQKPKRNGP